MLTPASDRVINRCYEYQDEMHISDAVFVSRHLPLPGIPLYILSILSLYLSSVLSIAPCRTKTLFFMLVDWANVTLALVKLGFATNFVPCTKTVPC